MKKALAIILTLIISVSSVVFPVSAQGKISDKTQQVMDNSEKGDKIPVWLWCTGLSGVTVERLAKQEYYEKYGLGSIETMEEVDNYREIYARIAKELEENACKLIIDDLKLTKEEILSSSGTMVVAYLTVDRILQASESEYVSYIDYDEDIPVELPTEISEIKEKFTTLYKTENNEISEVKELFNHKDKTGESDWVLISASTNEVLPMPAYAVLGDYVVTSNSISKPFAFGYCVYDVANDKFVDICNAYQAYEELAEQIDSMKLGKLIGDMDGDGKISIVDATAFQKCLVGITNFAGDDEIYGDKLTKELKYFSDFNRDGVRDISDATSIQYHLVGINK